MEKTKKKWATPEFIVLIKRSDEEQVLCPGMMCWMCSRYKPNFGFFCCNRQSQPPRP